MGSGTHASSSLQIPCSRHPFLPEPPEGCSAPTPGWCRSLLLYTHHPSDRGGGRLLCHISAVRASFFQTEESPEVQQRLMQRLFSLHFQRWFKLPVGSSPCAWRLCSKFKIAWLSNLVSSQREQLLLSALGRKPLHSPLQSKRL